MISRYLPANATLTERFGHLLYWLFEGMAADWRRRGLRHVHNGEITLRVSALWKRFRSVVARWEAGTLRAPGVRGTSPRPSPQSGEGEGSAASAQRPKPGWSVLPRTFGWLKSLLLPDRQHCVIAFNWLLLDDADMKALIAAAPVQIGRVLRPFCHILGLEVPAELRLPRRRRVRKKDTSPRPSTHSGEGEAKRCRRRTPREAGEDAIRESERTGKPIDPKKIGSVAFGYALHWPRDGNCPPPEIGYGGRRRRPPKDYRPPQDWE
jgi:hypothetical protein